MRLSHKEAYICSTSSATLIVRARAIVKEDILAEQDAHRLERLSNQLERILIQKKRLKISLIMRGLS